LFIVLEINEMINRSLKLTIKSEKNDEYRVFTLSLIKKHFWGSFLACYLIYLEYRQSQLYT
jgi:hypothetical protein